MIYFPNPLVQRTLLLLVVGAAGLIAIVGTSLWLSARTSSHAVEVVRARDIRTAAGNLLSFLQDMETGQRGYLLTRSDKYLEPYEAAKSQIAPTLTRLTASIVDAAATQDVSRLTMLTDEKTKELVDTIELVSIGRFDAALEIVKTGRGKAYMDEVRKLLDGLIDASESRVQMRLEDMRSTASALSWVSVLAALLISGAAGAAGWTVTRYTRELVEAQQKVETANASLEERVTERTLGLTRANDEIQRFAYIVTHDLRAPLVNILGFTSEMEVSLKALQRLAAEPEASAIDPAVAKEAKTAADTDLPEAIGFIRASSTKMDRLISAILKLSREGRRELNPQQIDLGALLEAARASSQHQLAESNANLEIAGRVPVIVSDRLAVEQIFGNLIDNAIKYLSADRPGRIKVSASERLGRVSVEVTDNGRGIAAADHERIFDLFRRAGAQDKAGEGIGLAHVRALVRRLGGDITVESEIGQGSRFTVSLPRILTKNSLEL